MGRGAMLISNIETRNIEIFLTLAKELHCARTAERMLMSPARLSLRLQALERRLGGRPFERSSRRVQLTPLGETLLRDLRPAFEQLEHVLQETRTHARHDTPPAPHRPRPGSGERGDLD